MHFGIAGEASCAKSLTSHALPYPQTLRAEVETYGEIKQELAVLADAFQVRGCGNLECPNLAFHSMVPFAVLALGSVSIHRASCS